MDSRKTAKILTSLGIGVVGVNSAGKLTFANPEAERLLGMGVPDVASERWAEAVGVYLPDGVTPCPTEAFPILRALHGEPCDDVEFVIRNPAFPEGVVVSVTSRPQRARDGRIVGAISAFRDVTAHVHERDLIARDRAFIATEYRIAAVANEAPAVVSVLQFALDAVCAVAAWPVGHAWWVDDATGAFVTTGVWHTDNAAASTAFCHATSALLLGGAEALLGDCGAAQWIPDLSLEPGFARGAAAAACGLQARCAFPVCVGRVVVGVLEFFTHAIRAPDPQLLSMMEQVGRHLGRVFERERATRRDQFVQAVVDHVADPIFVKDRSFRFVFLSRALCELVGHARAAMIGRTDYDFFSKDQSDFFRKKDRETFASEARVVIEEESITDAGGVEHVLATTKSPLRFGGPEITHIVGVIHDITRLKSVEAALSDKVEELAGEIVAKNVALSELESFSYTVSHDLRAPLRSVSGFLGLLEETERERMSPQGQACVARARAAVARMDLLIQDILALATASRAEMQIVDVDLGALALDVVADLRGASPERVVDVRIAPSLLGRGDPSLLRNLLVNLLGNAWKFTARRPIAHIAIGSEEREGERVFFVRDDGAGFDEGQAAHLFKPFQRLHHATDFAGTGVGLASVKRIVQRHGGRVWAEGALDRGATFWWTLPPPEDPAPHPRPPE